MTSPAYLTYRDDRRTLILPRVLPSASGLLYRDFLSMGPYWSQPEHLEAQRKYALEILEETSFLGAKPCNIPMEPNLEPNEMDGELISDPSSYRILVGKLIYLTITRPDLAYVVHTLSQFMDKPRTSHLDAAHWVLRYLKQSSGQGILLSASSGIQLHAFCDVNWARCRDTRRSVTRYCILLGKSQIS
ncbi:uncharacterized mitochondrial protein AtMg00810-like [Malania oleifera]|uniref:uncharacterized mitochondrial protein AtMg00810-like n=1 Tax=Malania oleifera TaxID=397392 RepID=UPI0025AE7DAD|nr:uncharacterized mitochondrial protein AtMg00810-like [Malania oleifera]